MILGDFFRKWSKPRRRHESLVFEVTQACNHDCLHCYNVWKGRGPYPAGELNTKDTLALYQKILKQSGARLITLSGGEPLLRKDIYKIIDFLHGSGVAINLITNGSLLTDDAIARLTPNKISIFEIPLLSADAETHDRLSGSTGAFDRATLAIAKLKAARQRVVSVFVATRLNLSQWPQTAELAFAMGVDGIMFNRFNPGGRGREHIEMLQASPEELIRALEFAQDFSTKHDYAISCSIAMPPCLFQIDHYSKLSFGFCAAGTDQAYYTVDPVGNLRPCNHSPMILGNLRSEGFWKMIEGKGLKSFIDSRPAFCRGCAEEKRCRGGCPAAAEACFGSPREMDPFLAANCGRARKVEEKG